MCVSSTVALSGFVCSSKVGKAEFAVPGIATVFIQCEFFNGP